jgi:hypothetical protein
MRSVVSSVDEDRSALTNSEVRALPMLRAMSKTVRMGKKLLQNQPWEDNIMVLVAALRPSDKRTGLSG